MQITWKNSISEKLKKSGHIKYGTHTHTHTLSLSPLTPSPPPSLTDEGVTVLVKALFVLALRRLAHQRVGDGPRDSGGVAAIVLQPLGNVRSLHLELLKLTHVKNELVRVETCREGGVYM